MLPYDDDTKLEKLLASLFDDDGGIAVLRLPLPFVHWPCYNCCSANYANLS